MILWKNPLATQWAGSSGYFYTDAKCVECVSPRGGNSYLLNTLNVNEGSSNNSK